MVDAKPRGYSLAQIGLHWTVAALVIFQYVSSDAVEGAYHAVHRGQAVSAQEALFANLHVTAGIAILLLAATRLAVRLWRGAPDLPPQHNRLLRLAARLTHLALYVAIFAMPFSGMAAWFGGVEPAGRVHSLGAALLFWLVIVHALAALAEHFYFRTDVLVRMLRPQPR